MTARPVPMIEALSPARMPSADELTEALASELSLIEDLLALMRQQREAVATNDIQTVDGTVFATHRVLATLGESHRRRRALSTLLGERSELPLETLDEVFGDRMTDSLRTVRAALVDAARTLSREVAINRHVLRQALAGGDAHLRALAGSPPLATYAPIDPAAESRSIRILNRQA